MHLYMSRKTEKQRPLFNGNLDLKQFIEYEIHCNQHCVFFYCLVCANSCFKVYNKQDLSFRILKEIFMVSTFLILSNQQNEVSPFSTALLGTSQTQQYQAFVNFCDDRVSVHNPRAIP